MPLDFPDSPTVGQKYSPASSEYQYEWDGEKWIIEQTLQDPGDLFTININGNPSRITPGANGQVLTSTGPTTVPTWQTPGGDPFVVNTLIIFPMSTTPSGWTLQTTSGYNDMGIRIANAASQPSKFSGVPFSTLGNTTTSGSTTLNVNHMPAHNHGVTGAYKMVTATENNDEVTGGGLTRGKTFVNRTFSTQGGNIGHTHTLSVNVRYLTCVVGKYNG